MKMTGAEILMECMVREGVEVAFGYRAAILCRCMMRC